MKTAGTGEGAALRFLYRTAPGRCALKLLTRPGLSRAAGRLLDAAVADLRAAGLSPVYLVTDHVGFYERSGWEFLCTATGDGASEPSRMYVKR